MRVQVRRSLQVVLVAVVAAAVLLPAGAVRALPREAPTPEQIATPACTQLQADLGSRFASAFGSFAGCVSKVAAVARSAIETCNTAADPGPCIEQALQKGIKALVAAAAAPSADQLAKQMCEQLQADLGPRFAAKFGSLAGCLSKVGSIARSAIEKCKTASAQGACIEQETKTALAALARESGPTATQIGDAITQAACEAAQEQLGSKFEKQFGSLAGCRAKIQARAAKLAGDALGRCQDDPNPEPCVRRAIEIDATGIRLALGAGAAPTADQIGDDVAGGACEAAKQKLGSRFAKQLGSLAACKAKIRDEAKRAGAEALATCKSAFDKESCMRQAIETGAVALQAALGAGSEPTAAQIVEEITGAACLAGEACVIAQATLRAGFEKRFASFEACKAKISAQATQLARDALAGCRSAASPWVCVRKAIEADAAGLKAALGLAR